MPSKIIQITGPAIVLRGDEIDTDRIMPARFLKAITFEGIDAHVFEDDRKESAARGTLHSFDDPARRRASVLIVNANFGCGSSREHAPQGLLRRGIRAIVGESFGEIFFGNSTAIGLVCVTASKGDVQRLMAIADQSASAPFDVNLETRQVVTGGTTIEVSIPNTARQALVSGEWDATGLLLDRYEEVEKVGKSLPYVTW
jgi:3-isopropylmalate/(R)-2-methylmalate dehydratase small subunit